MPRNPNNPKKSISLDEKLNRMRERLNEIDTNKGNINLVNKFINSLIMDGLSRQSCITYITSLRYVLQNTEIDFENVTKEDIENVLITLESWTAVSGRNTGKPLSPFTKNTIKMQLKRFLQFLGQDDTANVIRCKNLKGTKLPEDLLTKDEVLMIIDHAGSLRDKALFGLLYESGCRAGEILSMKVKNVEFLNNGGCAVTFPKGKTGPRRVLIFNFASYLRQWMEAHPLKDEPEATMWPTSDYRSAPLSDVGLRYLLRETVKRTGIKKRVWIHGFRHSRATHLAEHLTEQQMKKYLGWSAGSDMPATYVHLSGKDIDNAIKVMHGIEDPDTPIDTMKPGKCPRCHEMNPPKARYCFRCGLILTKEQSQTNEDTLNAILDKLKQNPGLLLNALSETKQNSE